MKQQKTKTPRALIFDLGGVIVPDVWENLMLDPNDGLAYIFGLDVPTVQKIGTDLWEKFAYRSIVENQTWMDLEKEYWELFKAQSGLITLTSDLIHLSKNVIRPITGILELLDELNRQNLLLAICSNNTEFWYQRERDLLNLDRFFHQDHVILSCRVGFPKTSRNFEMFKATVEALHVDKEDCIFIDDREESINFALRFGLTSVLFPSHSDFGAMFLRQLLGKMGIF